MNSVPSDVYSEYLESGKFLAAARTAILMSRSRSLPAVSWLWMSMAVEAAKRGNIILMPGTGEFPDFEAVLQSLDGLGDTSAPGKGRIAECVLLVANQRTDTGDIYSEECLVEAAKQYKNTHYCRERKALIVTVSL